MNHNSFSLCSSASSTASSNVSMFAGRIKTSANTSNPVQSTLPITCQICLSKVKEPCICPNLHVFCAMCIEIWLEKTKQCPTCRISINKENPCRRILGGIENSDDVDMLKPTEFSHPSTRKARYLSLFQQYEDEISRLLQQIDSLDAEVAKFKEASKNINPANVSANMSPNSAQYDMIQMLKTKLEQTQASLEEAIKERNKLKEINKKLESENSILLQDVAKLKVSLNEKSAQVSSRYTVAALENKLESYEKEVKQLQKALEKSDKYIADLECRLKINGGLEQTMGSSSNAAPTMMASCMASSNDYTHQTTTASTLHNAPANTHNQSGFTTGHTHSSSSKHHSSSSRAGDSSKTVKFADKIDTIPASHLLASPKHSSSSSSNRVILIPNERFYGSPSKTPTSAHKNAGSSISNVHISSFADRMKKSSTMSSSAESQPQQSMEADQTTPPSCSAAQNYLFSPMKRLRLDEVYLEKPNEQHEAGKHETNENVSPASSKYRLSKRSPSDTEVMKRLGNKFASGSFDKPSTATGMTYCSHSKTESDFMTTNISRSISPSKVKKEGVSSFSNELDDCLQLLNEAEKKVQNRESSSPPKISDHRLTRSPSCKEKSVAFDTNNTYTATYVNTSNRTPSPNKPKDASYYSSLPDKYFMSAKMYENDSGATSDSASTTTTTSSSEGVSSSSLDLQNPATSYTLGVERNYTTNSDHGPMFSYTSERRRSGSYSPSKSCSNMQSFSGKLVETSCNVNPTMPKNPIYAKYNSNSNGPTINDHDYTQPQMYSRNDYGRMNHN